jgi:hypothetical protein
MIDMKHSTNFLTNVVIEDDPEREKRDQERLNVLEEIFEYRKQEQQRLQRRKSGDDIPTSSNLELKSDEGLTSSEVFVASLF